VLLTVPSQATLPIVEMSKIRWILKACLWLHSSACTTEMPVIIYACLVLFWQCKFQAELGESRVVGDSTHTVLTGSLWPTCSWQWPLSYRVCTNHLEQWCKSTKQKRWSCKDIKECLNNCRYCLCFAFYGDG